VDAEYGMGVKAVFLDQVGCRHWYDSFQIAARSMIGSALRRRRGGGGGKISFMLAS
jgi:hypothetical protein